VKPAALIGDAGRALAENARRKLTGDSGFCEYRSRKEQVMATYSLDQVEIFGTGVLKAEGVVIDKENNVYGGGRNGIIYKVSPEGKVGEL
jgi:hypothetical protein